MVEFSERFYLPKLNAFVPIGVFLLHFFDGNHLASLGIRRLVDCSESTVSKRLYRLIFLHCTFNLSIKSISKTFTHHKDFQNMERFKKYMRNVIGRTNIFFLLDLHFIINDGIKISLHYLFQKTSSGLINF